MKFITLSVEHYRAIRNKQGAEAAVEEIRADISRLTHRNLGLSLRGPNNEGDRVAAIDFIRAAYWNPDTGCHSKNLLTCGFGEDDRYSVANLFTVLTHPQNILPEAEENDVAGLVLGSLADPAAFIRFER